MNAFAPWLNGKLVSPDSNGISPLDRGFALGDGVFETMLALNGRVIGFARHLDRLRYSAGVIDLPVPFDSVELAAGVEEVLRASGLVEAAIRLTVSRGVGAGLDPPGSTHPTTAITIAPHAGASHALVGAGIRMITASTRRNDTSPLSRIKSLNYLDNILARAEARRRGADDALMLNTKGHLACGTASNVFVVAGGAILTPPIEAGVLPGITRGYVLDLAGGIGIGCKEVATHPDEVRNAAEVFVTNSLLGIMPVLEVDSMVVGSGWPGEIARALAKSYRDTVMYGGSSGSMSLTPS